MRSDKGFGIAWCALNLLRNCPPIFAVYALMMQSHGLTPVDISLLFILWSLSALVFEVPSGAVSDRMDRRAVLMLSSFIPSVVFLLWYWQPTLAGYAAGFLLWGFAGSLWSGTAEAYLFERLAAMGAAERFQEFYGLGSASAQVGIALALFTGGWVSTHGDAVTVWLSAAVAALVALAIPLCFGHAPHALRAPSALAETPSAARLRATGIAGSGNTEVTPTRDVAFSPVRAAMREFRQNTAVRQAALAIGVGLAFYSCFEEYLPLLFDAAGLNPAMMGVWYGACYAARALAMASVGRLPGLARRFPPLWSLVVSGLLLAVGGMFGTPGLIIGCMLYFALNGIAEVCIVNDLQHQQRGDARATVMSLARLGILAAQPAVYMGIGWLATIGTWISTLWFVAAGTTITAALLLGRRQVRAPGTS